MLQQFAEVILPLPLYSTFTYSIPMGWDDDIRVGTRVLVQFGKRKFYTGIVNDLHYRKPEGYEVKDISAVLDVKPIVRYPQLKLWEWIAEYYLCSVGEVYKAAVPTGLKPESETRLSLNPDVDLIELEGTISEKEAVLLQVLESEKSISLSDIENKTKIKNTAALLRPLMEKGLWRFRKKWGSATALRW